MPEKNKEPLNSMRQDGLYFSPKDLENKAREVAKNIRADSFYIGRKRPNGATPPHAKPD